MLMVPARIVAQAPCLTMTPRELSDIGISRATALEEARRMPVGHDAGQRHTIMIV